MQHQEPHASGRADHHPHDLVLGELGAAGRADGNQAGPGQGRRSSRVSEEIIEGYVQRMNAVVSKISSREQARSEGEVLGALFAAELEARDRPKGSNYRGRATTAFHAFIRTAPDDLHVQFYDAVLASFRAELRQP
jgi:hypothetical protein